MKTHLLSAIALILISATLSNAQAQPVPQGNKIFSVEFAPRPVDQVEIGDFHFTPGQPAPVHTHKAPVVGYVSKGAIYYQIEGQKPQILRTGDAFYEPVGPRILHFDNASKTEEAVFTDFNLEQHDEPFIVFPTPPTAKIDRRAFPTAKLNGSIVDRVDGYAVSLNAGQVLATQRPAMPVFGYVAEGEVTLQIDDGAPQIFRTGQTYYQPASSAVTLANASPTQPAKVVNFYFRNSTATSIDPSKK